MSFIVPFTPDTGRSLTGVAAEISAALRGSSTLGDARSAVLFVIDGLGALQLRAHAAHARRIASLMRKKDVAQSVFPSTTAAALTSLLTSAHPSEHGLVGYATRDASTSSIVNQLTGWGTGAVQPDSWQRTPTVFETLAAEGHPTFAVGLSKYQGSGFSNAILRGATYVSENDIARRVRTAIALADANDGAFVYCYIPEVDTAGHKFGVASPQWLAALEDVDSAFSANIPADIGAIITADHGMINVPHNRHVLVGDGDERWDGVALVGGEPRMLHVYAQEASDSDGIAERWRDAAGASAFVATRAEAVASGLFAADLAPEVVSRIGDVLIITRGTWAYYDDRLDDKRAQRMVGQHGSITPEELSVPVIRAGAFAHSQ